MYSIKYYWDIKKRFSKKGEYKTANKRDCNVVYRVYYSVNEQSK